MVKKGKLVLLVTVIISVIVFGFISKSLVDDKPKVVLVLKGLNSQYWQIVKAGAEKAFKDFGIDGKVIGPSDGSAKEQGRLLEKTYKENPKVLITAPVDSSVIPILDKYTVNKKIPVLLVDQDEPWKNKTSYIGTDNVELGKRAGSLLGTQLQPGDKVAIIGGDLSISVFKERVNGAKMALKDAGIIVAAEKVGIPDDGKTANKEMKKILSDHPDIKGVITTHDIVALQVAEVLKEQGLTIPVIGADGIPDILKLIEDGTLSGTVAQNPYDMGYLSVENALKVTKGENVEKFVNTGVDIIIKENAKQRLDFLNNLIK
ncbi:sugar ABC transporter substrate-binding protein [Neobacillus ginsengisoli]|uniref:Ribose transport system substrate-binding protein n=1 Tax=Neobacillus ginsengisoli TaxID=904295 RepID=A0ABT9XV15_9BACI|nr:substrate-binding domain-containing protein [Neobacillus ginsengisoli]MDQ0199420.1 ribose transport system substrate-binding protein [Neobacillus ginsengisoli]